MGTLKQLMIDRAVRQSAVAAALCVSPSTVSKWANRDADIPVRFISPLAALLDASTDQVLAVAVARDRSPPAKDVAA